MCVDMVCLQAKCVCGNKLHAFVTLVSDDWPRLWGFGTGAEAFGQVNLHPAFNSPDAVELIDTLNPTVLRRLVNVLYPNEFTSEEHSEKSYGVLYLVVPA